MDSKIWLSSPHMGDKELEFVQEAFLSNRIAPLGPHVDGFEQDLETFLGQNVKVAALSSGTAALHLALVLLGIGTGDEVICQSMTFSASANPIAYQGALPVFVDSELDTWNMDPECLENAILARLANGKMPKAIVVVHLYGMPAQIDLIMEIACKYGIPVIEDAAEALGSSYKGQAVGTFGDLGILSFNGNKIITTSGGGALISKNEVHIKKARFLATQARDVAPHYQHTHIGYNYRMSNICAAIGRGQMKVLKERIKQRRYNNAFYKTAFREISGVSFLEEPNKTYFANCWLTTLLFHEQAGITREDIRLALGNRNIEARPLWKPMHLQPVFQYAPFYGNGNAEYLFEKGLCLPSGSNLYQNDLLRVVNTILEILSVHSI